MYVLPVVFIVVVRIMLLQQHNFEGTDKSERLSMDCRWKMIAAPATVVVVCGDGGGVWCKCGNTCDWSMIKNQSN